MAFESWPTHATYTYVGSLRCRLCRGDAGYADSTLSDHAGAGRAASGQGGMWPRQPAASPSGGMAHHLRFPLRRRWEPVFLQHAACDRGGRPCRLRPWRHVPRVAWLVCCYGSFDKCSGRWSKIHVCKEKASHPSLNVVKKKVQPYIYVHGLIRANHKFNKKIEI